MDLCFQIHYTFIMHLLSVQHVPEIISAVLEYAMHFSSKIYGLHKLNQHVLAFQLFTLQAIK